MGVKNKCAKNRFAIQGVSFSSQGKTAGIIRSAKGVFVFFFNFRQVRKGRVVTREHQVELIRLEHKLTVKLHTFVVTSTI